MREEHDEEHYRELAAHAGELATKMQLDILELQRIIKLMELAAMQGWPSYLPSPAMPMEEEK